MGDKWVADTLEADNMRVGDIEDTLHRLGKVGSPRLLVA